MLYGFKEYCWSNYAAELEWGGMDGGDVGEGKMEGGGLNFTTRGNYSKSTP